MTPLIRNMLAADLPLLCAAIEQQVTPHPWRESQFRESLDKHQCLTMVLQNQLVGYAVYTIVLGRSRDSEYCDRGGITRGGVTADNCSITLLT